MMMISPFFKKWPPSAYPRSLGTDIHFHSEKKYQTARNRIQNQSPIKGWRPNRTLLRSCHFLKNNLETVV